jgi:hypothetical protein
MSERDVVTAAGCEDGVIFRIDPAKARFRRRFLLIVVVGFVGLFWVAGLLTRQLGAWITLPVFLGLVVAVVVGYWTPRPPVLVISREAVRLDERSVPWADVHHVEITSHATEYGGFTFVHIKLGERSSIADLMIYPPESGATATQVEEALRRYGPPGLEFRQTPADP